MGFATFDETVLYRKKIQIYVRKQTAAACDLHAGVHSENGILTLSEKGEACRSSNDHHMSLCLWHLSLSLLSPGQLASLLSPSEHPHQLVPAWLELPPSPSSLTQGRRRSLSAHRIACSQKPMCCLRGNLVAKRRLGRLEIFPQI